MAVTLGAVAVAAVRRLPLFAQPGVSRGARAQSRGVTVETNRLFALLGRPFAHLDQEDGNFENDDAQAEEEGRGDGPASENDDEGAAGGSTPLRGDAGRPPGLCAVSMSRSSGRGMVA